tara:strand:- start:892 stop:1392 length:501 start_codon:yes stop_codon:yes gene_type:complete
MSTLIAIVFKHDESGAEVALQKLRELENEYLVDLEDAVIARRLKNGEVKLTQSVNLVSSGAWYGAVWGLIIGFLFTGPLGWIVVGGVGAGFGALAGYSNDYGIDDNFIKQLSKDLEPCCSALFILVRQMTEDKVLEELQGVGGTILKTSLSKEMEEKLQHSIEKQG